MTPSPVPQPADQIRIGRVGKAHGVRGSFYVDGAIDARALVAGFMLWIDDQGFTVRTRGGTDARPLLSLEGINDRDAAAALRGRTLFAARATLTPLSEGEWYASDLEGMAVVVAGATSPTPLGRVSALRNLPSVDVLEVAPTSGGEPLLVPMVDDAIVSIDVTARTVVVDAAFLGLAD